MDNLNSLGGISEARAGSKARVSSHILIEHHPDNHLPTVNTSAVNNFRTNAIVDKATDQICTKIEVLDLSMDTVDDNDDEKVPVEITETASSSTSASKKTDKEKQVKLPKPTHVDFNLPLSSHQETFCSVTC